MKQVFTVLLLLAATVRLDAALTVTFRGTTTVGAAGTTLVCVPSSTIAAGSFAVLFIWSNNSGTNGATKIITTTPITDSVGNSWTQRVDALYDPSTANSGVEVAIYTAPIVTQLTTSNNVTVTWSTSSANRGSAFYEVSGSGGTPTYVSSAAISDGLTSGQTGTAVAMVTGSITNNNVVLCSVSSRQTGAGTGDSDTTNGSWTALEGVTGGSIRGERQTKIVTATATQTWNVTLAGSAAWQSAWIEVAEATAAATNPGAFLQLF